MKFWCNSSDPRVKYSNTIWRRRKSDALGKALMENSNASVSGTHKHKHISPTHICDNCTAKKAIFPRLKRRWIFTTRFPPIEHFSVTSISCEYSELSKSLSNRESLTNKHSYNIRRTDVFEPLNRKLILQAID